MTNQPGVCLAASADESPWRLGAAFGYGLRTNPLVQSEDIPIVVDLDIAWFGEHFFFDNGDLGLTLADGDFATVSLIARLNSDRVFFGKTNTRLVSFDLAGQALAEATEFKVPNRDFAVELGVELLAGGNWGHLQMSAYHDVSNTHDGYEIYADYGYGWREHRWYFEPSVGLSYKSDAMNDYYWGVREDESGVVLPAYDAKAGTNAHARLMLSYQISKQWSFSLVTEFERLNDEAASSPLVADQNIMGYFAGFGMRFN